MTKRRSSHIVFHSLYLRVLVIASQLRNALWENNLLRRHVKSDVNLFHSFDIHDRSCIEYDYGVIFFIQESICIFGKN